MRTHVYSYVSSIAPSLYLLCKGMLGVWGVGEGVLALPSPSVAGPEPLRTTPSRSESLVEAGRAEKRGNGEGGKKSERKKQRGVNVRDGGHKRTQRQKWKGEYRQETSYNQSADQMVPFLLVWRIRLQIHA